MTSARLVFFLAPWVSIPGPQPQDSPASATVLEAAAPVTSSIGDSNPIVSTAKIEAGHADAPVRGRAFLVRVPETGPYTIDLESHFFDAYLVLRDEAGNVLAEDDDGFIGTHARLVIERLSPESALWIDACALHGGSGEFVVSLRPGAAPAPTGRERRALVLEDARERLLAVEAARGPEEVETADCAHALALLLKSEGRLAEARTLFERTLSIREKLLGPEHLVTVESIHTLAITLMNEGRLAEARPLFERSLAIRERVLGPEHRNTAVSLGQLGVLLRYQAEYAAALNLLERSAAVMERSSGPDDLYTGTSLHNWAACAMDMGDYATARRLTERALAIYEKKLGPENPDVATLLGSLALVQQLQGDLAAALSGYERAIAISEKALGPDHPATSVLLSNRASLFELRGEYERARPEFERVLSTRERVLGRDHPGTATDLFNLAALLEAQGDFDAALPLYERVLAIRERVYGPAHPQTALTLNNLAYLRYSRGEYVEARRLCERALATFETKLGPEHVYTATALDGLAVFLTAEGDSAAALPLFERALRITETALGPEHPVTAQKLANVADCLGLLGKYDSGRWHYERALAILDASLGSSHVDTTKIRNGYVRMMLDRGDWERAYAETEIALAAAEEAARLRFVGQNERERFAFLSVLRPVLEACLGLSRRFPPREAATYEKVLLWKGLVSRGLAAGPRSIESGAPPEALAAISDLRATQARLSRLVSALAADSGDSTRREIAELGERRGRLEREILGRLGPSAEDHHVSISELAGLLTPGSVIVDFLVHRDYEPAVQKEDNPRGGGRWTTDQVTAWVTRPGDAAPRRIELGPALPIEAAAGAYLAEMRESLVAARGISGTVPSGAPKSNDANDRLRALLYAPLRSSIENASLVVVSPDGFLGAVPLGTIRTEDGAYLLERTSFVTLQAVASLGSIQDGVRSEHPSVLVAGGIDYGEGGDTAASAAAARDVGGLAPSSSRRPAWKPLPFTGREALSIASSHERRFGSDGNATRIVFQHAEATEARLKLELPRHTQVHLATHGYFRADGDLPRSDALRNDAPRQGGAGLLGPGGEVRRLTGLFPGLLSALVLAGANRAEETNGEDGLLTAEEVSWMDLSHCELVVLSACDSGLGQSQAGEGMLGLRRAFRQAGARTVVSSLWRVDDESTADLMNEFYENLWHRNQGTLEALRNAQLKRLRENRERHRGDGLPYTWGAFVLDGDWR